MTGNSSESGLAKATVHRGVYLAAMRQNFEKDGEFLDAGLVDDLAYCRASDKASDDARAAGGED